MPRSLPSRRTDRCLGDNHWRSAGGNRKTPLQKPFANCLCCSRLPTMADDQQHPWDPDPDQDVTLDSRLLRALAHPMRNRMLGILRAYGPATATTLAARLGVNTGAT